MTLARAHQVALDTTRYYHCISRCVRRAFLCGNDPLTGKNMDHRKGWILQRLQQLTESFAISVCAYAVMDNHYHLVLYVDLEQAQSWTDEEVFSRWKALGKKKKGEQEKQEGITAKERQQSGTWRERLTDLSWFMRFLNEKIARDANQEDNCTGRFWQGRFQSQALIDEGALLACMAYVDLNPVRAKVCQKPEESSFTSIYQRIQEVQSSSKSTSSRKSSQKKTSLVDFTEKPHLMPFQEKGRAALRRLPIEKEDYLTLVDWTGRAHRKGKSGKISEALSSILMRLGLQKEGWIKMTSLFTKTFARAAGEVQKLKALGEQWGQKWLKGSGSTQSFYSTC